LWRRRAERARATRPSQPVATTDARPALDRA
jgi:hypothetical protein